MSWTARVLVALIANILGLLAAAYFVAGFSVAGDAVTYLKIGLILTVLNFVLKPILKLIFTPVIILTLGLGIIVVNALVLYVLDFLSPDLTIQGTLPLVCAAILIGAINFVFHLVTKVRT
jgi:putative membrane protein